MEHRISNKSMWKTTHRVDINSWADALSHHSKQIPYVHMLLCRGIDGVVIIIFWRPPFILRSTVGGNKFVMHHVYVGTNTIFLSSHRLFDASIFKWDLRRVHQTAIPYSTVLLPSISVIDPYSIIWRKESIERYYHHITLFAIVPPFDGNIFTCKRLCHRVYFTHAYGYK